MTLWISWLKASFVSWSSWHGRRCGCPIVSEPCLWRTTVARSAVKGLGNLTCLDPRVYWGPVARSFWFSACLYCQIETAHRCWNHRRQLSCRVSGHSLLFEDAPVRPSRRNANSSSNGSGWHRFQSWYCFNPLSFCFGLTPSSVRIYKTLGCWSSCDRSRCRTEWTHYGKCLRGLGLKTGRSLSAWPLMPRCCGI